MRRRRLDPIDQVLALDLGGRGIGAIFTPGAAVAAARSLVRARRVLIVTGFCVPPGVPETDGPPGAAVLGRALRRLGAAVRYVTDAAVVPALAAALKALDEPPDIEVYAAAGDAAALLERERPSHLVAIERPGRNRGGDYLSARGESVAAWNDPIDSLFLVRQPGGRRRTGRSKAAHRSRGVRATTIGIGDGGNEIGMGNVRVRLARESRLMARITSVVPVDHLVVAGVSNWAAYGVVTALERLARRPLLHTPERERALVEACVEAGAVDGVSRKPEATVDALPLEAHGAVVALLALAGRGSGSVIMGAR